MPWGHGCGPELPGSRSSGRDFPFLCSTCLLPQTQSYTFMTAFTHSFSKCLLRLLWARHLLCALPTEVPGEQTQKVVSAPLELTVQWGRRAVRWSPRCTWHHTTWGAPGKTDPEQQTLARVGTSQGIPGVGGTPSHPELLFCKFPMVHGEQAIHGTCCVVL